MFSEVPQDLFQCSVKFVISLESLVFSLDLDLLNMEQSLPTTPTYSPTTEHLISVIVTGRRIFRSILKYKIYVRYILYMAFL